MQLHTDTIARNTGETANNTSVLSDMHNTLKNMDGRLRTIESESSKDTQDDGFLF